MTDETLEPAALPACTVLLVDDSPEDRTVYRDYLEQNPVYNYTVLEADNLEDGVRLCRAVQVDCVLLDFGLPDGDGLEFIGRLTDANGDDALPAVVVITGRGSEMVAVQCLKQGAADYLMKATLTPEVLFRAMRNALERSRMRAHLAQEQQEREQAEAELRDSEARFRLLIDSVRDYAIFMLDPEGKVSSWNAGARALLGFHDTEIVGQHVRQLFTPEDVRGRVPEHALAAAQSAPQIAEEGWLVGRQGARVWMVRVISPVVDRFGLLQGFSVVLRDTTERRQTDLRLQDALRARDAFLAVVSRELKTPVSGVNLQVQGLLRLIARREAPAEPLPVERIVRNLREVDAALRGLAALLGSVFDASWLKERELPYTPSPVDLGQLAQRIVDDARLTRGDSQGRVDLEVCQDVSGMWDAPRLERALSNLLLNAHEHAAGKAIEVRVGRRGRRAFIDVTDHGSGIDARHQARIFERFTGDTDGHGELGTHLGMGLFVSRFLVEALGGTIEVDSDVGAGATFKLELPIEADDVRPHAQ